MGREKTKALENFEGLEMNVDNIPDYFQLTTQTSFSLKPISVFCSLHCSPESMSPYKSFKLVIINFSSTFLLICVRCHHVSGTLSTRKCNRTFPGLLKDYLWFRLSFSFNKEFVWLNNTKFIITRSSNITVSRSYLLKFFRIKVKTWNSFVLVWNVHF
jgi:hypothetical protein